MCKCRPSNHTSHDALFYSSVSVLQYLLGEVGGICDRPYPKSTKATEHARLISLESVLPESVDDPVRSEGMIIVLYRNYAALLMVSRKHISSRKWRRLIQSSSSPPGQGVNASLPAQLMPKTITWLYMKRRSDRPGRSVACQLGQLGVCTETIGVLTSRSHQV